jgi:hypothetical protein
MLIIIVNIVNIKISESFNCIYPEIKNEYLSHTTNNETAKKIISEKNPSITSISNYNNSYNKYVKEYSNIQNMPDCRNYCPQGSIKNGNCICPPEFPVPIIINDKVYCSNEDCTKIPNATFVPSSSNDPSQNKCNCNSGFVKDGSFCKLYVPYMEKVPKTAHYLADPLFRSNMLQRFNNYTEKQCSDSCLNNKDCTHSFLNSRGNLVGGGLNFRSRECVLMKGDPRLGSAPQSDSYLKK